MLHELARLMSLLLVLARVAPPAQAESWFFRPWSAAHVHLAGDLEASSPGASYATAWTSVATIAWARISPGDTLFVCGLHDGGSVDGALNITKAQGSGVAGAPVTIDGRCVDDAGRADPGTLMAGKLVTPRELGSAGAYGIFTYSYDSPALASRRGGQHPLGALGMSNMPDIIERSDGSVVRLKHGDCDAKALSNAGCPVHPERWAPGTACYTGIWTNRTTIYYKPSAGVIAATLVVYEYNRPSSRTVGVNGLPPLALHYAEHVIVRNLTLQGPAWEVVSAVGGHHIELVGNLIRWASFAGRTHIIFYHNGATSFAMCFGRSTLGAGKVLGPNHISNPAYRSFNPIDLIDVCLFFRRLCRRRAIPREPVELHARGHGDRLSDNERQLDHTDSDGRVHDLHAHMAEF